jgi:hypothetical protein
MKSKSSTRNAKQFSSASNSRRSMKKVENKPFLTDCEEVPSMRNKRDAQTPNQRSSGASRHALKASKTPKVTIKREDLTD